MGLESATYISQLVTSNPAGADDYSTADDHLRLLKAVLQAQFPNFGAVAITPDAAELNKLDGLTATQADLGLLAGAQAGGLTFTELMFLNGVTSAIQTQIDAKAASSHAHAAADVTSGTLAAARIPSLPTSQITTGTFADARIAATNVTQHEASVDHNALANYNVAEHRTINDAGIGAADLLSAQKILALVATTTKYKTALEDRTNTALLVNDTHMAGWTVEAAEYYEIDGYLRVTQAAAAGGGLKLHFNFDQAVEGAVTVFSSDAGGGVTADHSENFTDSILLANPSDTEYGVHIKGIIKGHATLSATFDLSWAQETADTDKTTLKVGSYLTLKKIS